MHVKKCGASIKDKLFRLPWHIISIVCKMRMIAFTIYSFAIISFAMADPLPQGKGLISTIHSFDIHYRQKLGIICIVCHLFPSNGSKFTVMIHYHEFLNITCWKLTNFLSFFVCAPKNSSNCSFGEIHASTWRVFFFFFANKSYQRNVTISLVIT